MESVDWLTLENKIRKLVKELVEPTIRRALENRDALEKLKKREAIMQEKIDEQELNLAKVSKKVNTIDDYSRRLMEFEASLRMFEAQIAHAKESMLTESDGLNKKIVYLEEMVRVLEHQREQQRSDMNYTNQNIVELNAELIRRITALAEVETNNNTAILVRASAAEERMATLEAYNKVIQESLGNAETNLERLKKTTEETNETMIKIKESVKTVKSEQIEMINTTQRQVIAHGTQMQQSLQKFGQFLDSDYAIKMQFTISEILHHCLDLKQRKKLAEYEKLRMQLLEQSGKSSEYTHEIQKMLDRAHHVLESPDKTTKDLDIPNSASSKSIHKSVTRINQGRNSKGRRVMTQINNSGAVLTGETEEELFDRDGSVLSINTHSEYDDTRVKKPMSRGSHGSRRSSTYEKIAEEEKSKQNAKGVSESTPRGNSVRAVREVRNFRNQDSRVHDHYIRDNRSNRVADAEHSEGSVHRTTRRHGRNTRHDEPGTQYINDPDEESKRHSQVSSQIYRDETDGQDPRNQSRPYDEHSSRRGSNKTNRQTRTDDLDREAKFNRVSSIRGIDAKSDVSLSSQPMNTGDALETTLGNERYSSTEGHTVLRPLDSTEHGRTHNSDTRNSSAKSGEAMRVNEYPHINRKISEKVMEGSDNVSPSPLDNELYPEDEMSGVSQHIEEGGSLPGASDEGLMIYYTESHEQVLDDLRNNQEDIERRMEDNYQDLVVQIDDIKAHLLDLVTKKTDDIKKQSSSLEALAQQAIWECTTATKQRKRDFSDNRAQFQKITGNIEMIYKSQNELNDYIELHKRVLEALIEFCRIDQALYSQDEEDRDSVVLMGYKEHPRENLKSKIISIDKSCLSCTSQNSVVLSAFKMACLQYQPSSVNYNLQPYNRKELLHIRGRLLEALPFIEDLDNSTKEMPTQANGARTIDNTQIM